MVRYVVFTLRDLENTSKGKIDKQEKAERASFYLKQLYDCDVKDANILIDVLFMNNYLLAFRIRIIGYRLNALKHIITIANDSFLVFNKKEYKYFMKGVQELCATQKDR